MRITPLAETIPRATTASMASAKPARMLAAELLVNLPANLALKAFAALTVPKTNRASRIPARRRPATVALAKLARTTNAFPQTTSAAAAPAISATLATATLATVTRPLATIASHAAWKPENARPQKTSAVATPAISATLATATLATVVTRPLATIASHAAWKPENARPQRTFAAVLIARVIASLAPTDTARVAQRRSTANSTLLNAFTELVIADPVRNATITTNVCLRSAPTSVPLAMLKPAFVRAPVPCVKFAALDTASRLTPMISVAELIATSATRAKPTLANAWTLTNATIPFVDARPVTGSNPITTILGPNFSLANSLESSSISTKLVIHVVAA